MASLAALVRDNTTLDRDQVSHLNRLTSEWGMLADFCFADLLLYVPTKDERWLIVGQVRPATAQTVYHTDWVGAFANVSEQSVLRSAFGSGEITEGDVEIEDLADSARMLAIPVRHDGRAIAVLTREWVQRAGRPPGELERTYVSIFDRFAEMIAEGWFPYPTRGADSTAAPRVGDGVMSLDADGRVTYLSPNANSALHRVGIHANAVGTTLAEIGFHDEMVRKAFEQRVAVVEEFEPASDIALLCRCLPILARGEVAGGVLLVRDVTDVRKRDRLLISKDATIREIHHPPSPGLGAPRPRPAGRRRAARRRPAGGGGPARSAAPGRRLGGRDGTASRAAKRPTASTSGDVDLAPPGVKCSSTPFGTAVTRSARNPSPSSSWRVKLGRGHGGTAPVERRGDASRRPMAEKGRGIT